MTPEEAQELAKSQAGVMLPGVDPAIGEIVLSAFFANEDAPVGEVIGGLIKTSPDHLTNEIASACFEMLLCSERGELRWLNMKSQALLVGIRPMSKGNSICFGVEAHWPMDALLVGPPKAVTIRLAKGSRRVFLACEGLDGAVVPQSEAIALGNAMVECFGGQIVEDREGPEIMQQSFLEGSMTKRAQMRAQAVTARKAEMPDGSRPDHLRLAMAEASPGSCDIGMVLQPEGEAEPLYEVESRVNDSWVILVAAEAGSAGDILAGAAWVGHGTFCVQEGPFGPEAPPHWGFTDEGARAQRTKADDDDGPAEDESEAPAE